MSDKVSEPRFSSPRISSTWALIHSGVAAGYDDLVYAGELPGDGAAKNTIAAP